MIYFQEVSKRPDKVQHCYIFWLKAAGKTIWYAAYIYLFYDTLIFVLAALMPQKERGLVAKSTTATNSPI